MYADLRANISLQMREFDYYYYQIINDFMEATIG